MIRILLEKHNMRFDCLLHAVWYSVPLDICLLL